MTEKTLAIAVVGDFKYLRKYFSKFYNNLVNNGKFDGDVIILTKKKKSNIFD